MRPRPVPTRTSISMRPPSFGNGLHSTIGAAPDVVGPYLLLESTLDACLQEFMAKPAPIRHLYEVHTSPQPPLVSAVLSEEIVAELARLRDFL